MEERDAIDERLERAGDAWRSTLPPLGDYRPIFRRRVNANPPERSLLLSLASALVVLAVVGGGLLLIRLPSGPVSPGSPTVPPTSETTEPSGATSSPEASAVPPSQTTGVVSPSPSAQPSLVPGAWREVGSGAGVMPIWAPDSQHLLLLITPVNPIGATANPPEEVHLLDRAGSVLASFIGMVEPVWLDADTFVGYDADFDQGSGFGPVPGKIVNVTDVVPLSVMLRCCQPISNGHGAVAVTRFLPEINDVLRPRFMITEDGAESQERDGWPLVWSAQGDRLIVLHPEEPTRGNEGWLEVVSWPDDQSIFQDDSSRTIGGAAFDPTGAYVAYRYSFSDDSGQSHSEVDIVNLETAQIVRIPVLGNSTFYAWDSTGQLLVASSGDRSIAAYNPDGTLVATRQVTRPVILIGSSNGQTLLSYEVSNSDSPMNLRLLDGPDEANPVGVPQGEIRAIYLSPDGDQMLLTVASDTGETAYLAATTQ